MKRNFKYVEYIHYQKCKDSYDDILKILIETDSDFTPSISSKYNLEDVAKKYSNLANVIIAYFENTPIGLVAFYPNINASSYMSIIMVTKRFRGLSIGKSLEEKCINYCMQISSNSLSLNMRKSNISLFNSRIRMGYKIIKEYYTDFSNELIVDLIKEF